MDSAHMKKSFMVKQPEEIFDTVMIVETRKEKSQQNTEKILDVLKNAYGQKIARVEILDAENNTFGLDWDPSFDPLEKLIIGPHPKAPEAAEFRAFWGNKSTLHRINGSYAEAVKINGENPIIEIATLALSIHFSKDVSVTIANRTLEGIFSVGMKELPKGKPSEAFAALSDKLTSLKDLPVSVINVIPISPFLRGTSVFPYTALDGRSEYLCKCADKIDIIIKLQGFDAWPTKLKQLIPFKVAVYISLHKALKELGIQSQPTMEGLDILFNGYVFSAYGIHNNEMSDFNGTEHGDEIDMLDRIQKIHHSTIRATTEKYHSFGEATRAAIRWVRCKGVQNELFSSEAIEIILAYIYESTVPPKFAYTGFLRFLSIIANISLSERNIFRINGCEHELPESDKRLLIVAAPYCRKSQFTNNGPSKMVLKRLKAAATYSLNDALTREFSNPTDTLKRVFTSIANKKAEIDLDYKKMPWAGRSIFSKKYYHGDYDVKGVVSPQLSDLFVGFNPVHQFIIEIEQRYGDIFDFWYNEYGGTKIGISWDNGLLDSKRPIEDPNFNMSKRVGKELVCDIDAILSQIAVLGGDLIKSIKRIE